MLSLQGMAGIGIPGTAGTKGEEGEQVGWESHRFALKSPQCLQSLLQYLGFPWDPVVPHGKGERRDSGFKIGDFTVSSGFFLGDDGASRSTRTEGGC